MADAARWQGRKSKRSNTPGSGGYTAEAHDAQLRVEQNADGHWSFVVETFRVGRADTREEAQAAALALAERLSLVK